MKAPAGHTLVELGIAVALTGLVGAALAGTSTAAQAVARRHSWAVRAGGAIRVAGAVLGDELRFLDPVADLRAMSRDSVAIRAFRGVGIACAAAPGDGAAVRYRGLREPEPEKDSVLIVDSIGGERPVPLLASEAAGGECGTRAGETLYRWTLPDAPAAGTLLLLFESGSYHLADHALRYRRGDGGRQPLTDELLDVRRSAFTPAPGAPAIAAGAAPLALEATFAARVDAAGGRGDARRPVARYRFPLLNARAVESRW